MTESAAPGRCCAWRPAGVLAFLYLPLVILAIYAFNPSRIQAWPPSGFTLHWFGEAARKPGAPSRGRQLAASWRRSRRRSRWSSGPWRRSRSSGTAFFGRETISFLLVLPIALPGVVTGIALRTTFVTFGVDFGLLTIVVGHATFCVVIAYNNVIARLRRLPRSPEEASADLGADIVHDLPADHAARHGDGAAVRGRCSPSRCRSTRSSSRTSPPAPARRRSRCGS